MSIKEKVNQYIQKHKPKSPNDIFGHFKMDTDLAIIAIHLMDWDTQEFIESLTATHYSDLGLIDRLEKYSSDFELSNLLIPKTAQCAVVMYHHSSFRDLTLLDNIIQKASLYQSYIEDLGRFDLFQGEDVIFFTENIDKKDYITNVHNQVALLNVTFQNPIHMDILKRFKLQSRLKPDEFMITMVEKLLEEYDEDIVKPIYNSHRILIVDGKIKYDYNISNLNKEASIGQKQNYKKLVKKIIKDSGDVLSEEIKEGLIEFVLSFTSLPGQPILTKGIRVIIDALGESAKDIDEDKVKRDVRQFKKSGLESIEHWYKDKIKREFKKAFSIELSSSSIEEITNKAYSTFINKYFKVALSINSNSIDGKQIDINLPHTDLVLQVKKALSPTRIFAN